MLQTSQSARVTLLDFHKDQHGRYLGQATFRMPSGAIRELDAYRDEFRSADDALSVGDALHEIQAALKAALLEAHPELSLGEDEEAAP